MLDVDLKALISRLGAHCASALHGAAGLCIARGHYEVTLEHHLLKLLEDPRSDIPLVLSHFQIDPGPLQRAAQDVLDGLRTGNAGKPVFSPLLIEWFQDAWLLGSVEYGHAELRSGTLLLALLVRPERYATSLQARALQALRRDELKRQLPGVVRASSEAPIEAPAAAPGSEAGAPAPGSALDRYTVNFTRQAREGNLDPVFGRDAEIRQMIDILARRRKNNPIVVGDPGVGKTAVVEGLALRIVEGDVPDVLKGVEVLSLDLGLLQAGAGVRGEFESRLKAVIAEVKASPVPLVLFIDEAHTLIGAGGAQGGGDAANLLKPALARGELRTVAATTWSEYKKYFEKDAALARRFQLVQLGEPGEAAAIGMLRGLKERYEQVHGVHVRDDAVVAAVRLSTRYLTGRQLPDKAVDLLDTCSARVKIGLATRPPAVEDLERRIGALERERHARGRDREAGVAGPEGEETLVAEVAALRDRADELLARWKREREAVEQVFTLRKELGAARGVAEGAEGAAEGRAGPPAAEPTGAGGAGAGAGAGEKDRPPPEAPRPRDEIRGNLAAALESLRAVQGNDPLVHPDVGPEVVAAVVSDWTGIPVGRMVADEARALLTAEASLRARIRGQDDALSVVARRLRDARAGLQDPRMPLGVFLLVGPSGVGKTETALALADLLFGGERSVITLNMSEFQEKHTVSRLIGSPPGYVGYGEGGVLTEAVRQRPYSVVLLDEVEKADPEVLNLFYQVFDKGSLADGEGREIDFRNTLILLTSNLGTDRITQELGRPRRDPEGLVRDIRPILSRHFKPALLARMTVVPYYPLAPDVLREIVSLKLGHVASRLGESHRVELTWEPAVEDVIAARCTEVETGARNVDHIVRGTLVPVLSHEVLSRLGDGSLPKALRVEVDPAGAFVVTAPPGGEP